jgi:hypothetical protein
MVASAQNPVAAMHSISTVLEIPVNAFLVMGYSFDDLAFRMSKRTVSLNQS